MSEAAMEENGEGGRQGAPMEVISTTMTATSTLPMAMGMLHACVHSVYERQVVEGRVEAGEAGVSLM